MSRRFLQNAKARSTLARMDKSTLGSRLASLRNRAGMTQAQVAAKMALATQQISAWETGANQPLPDALGRYLDAVGAAWADLDETGPRDAA